ncbi:MAG: 3-phosphoshikimate 1-carboxyvinyltransferase, partial [Clostridia bacterium]|nr:3-phosphoshikimate 1-carboxyvinyltransferase [Clostridia bacterium]
MICEVTPSVASGTVQAPGSKSMTHRLLICGGLAQGESVVHGVSLSSDIRATLDCLSALGATYTYHQDDIRIAGCDPKKNRGAILSCRESASTLRFFLPLCLLSGYRYRMTGSNRLMQRPLSVYQSLCNKEGFLFSRSSDGKGLVIQG